MLASALQHDASIVKALATSTCLQMGGLAHECNRSETLHEEGHENIWIYACPVILRHLTCQQESLRLLLINFNYALFLPRGKVRLQTSCRNCCQNPTPCWPRQIQARHNQPWVRCSVFILPPASQGQWINAV